jgi:hypothetical protein
MSASGRASFEGGGNIAMKLPRDQFAGTVRFYRDRLRLPVLEETDESVVFAFGHQKLWLDRADNMTRAEIWLDVVTDDLEGAADILEEARTDDPEPLPDGFEGFWVRNPADVVHLVSKK